MSRLLSFSHSLNDAMSVSAAKGDRPVFVQRRCSRKKRDETTVCFTGTQQDDCLADTRSEKKKKNAIRRLRKKEVIESFVSRCSNSFTDTT